MRSALFTILLALSGVTLAGCGPVEDEPSTSEPQETSKPKTIGPVVIIHCTLKSYHTGLSTTGTYFTYDTRTIDTLSDEIVEAENMDAGNAAHFKEHFARYQLQDSLVVLPLRQHDNKFRIDIKETWYLHGLSKQFVRPDPIWGDNLGRAQLVHGTIVFGDKVSNVDGKKRMLYEGALHLSSGNQYGGTAGTWTYYGKGDVEPENREWGYLHCGEVQPKPDSITIPGGL